MKEELDTVLKTIKSRKAVGLDETPPEVCPQIFLYEHTPSIVQCRI